MLSTFYCAVVQAMLFLGADTWVILAPMAHSLEGAYVGFLQKFKKKKSKRLRDGSLRQETGKSPQGSRGTDTWDICVQETGNSGGVGGLRTIFDLCTRETSYEGWWRPRVPWWM